jgi:hypothetical protein
LLALDDAVKRSARKMGLPVVELEMKLYTYAADGTFGASPLLETLTSSRGSVIDQRKIVELPLNGRDYNQLACARQRSGAKPRLADWWQTRRGYDHRPSNGARSLKCFRDRINLFPRGIVYVRLQHAKLEAVCCRTSDSVCACSPNNRASRRLPS